MIEHRVWIGGRIATLMGHYWRETDSAELRQAMAKDWADVLDGLPKEAIRKGCLAFQRTEAKRRPTPAAIFQLAKDFVPRAAVVYCPPFHHVEPKEPRCDRATAQAICEEYGFVPKRFGTAHSMSVQPTNPQEPKRTEKPDKASGEALMDEKFLSAPQEWRDRAVEEIVGESGKTPTQPTKDDA